MQEQLVRILVQLRDAGVLDHLSANEAAAVDARVEGIDVGSPTLVLDVLGAIPDAVFCPEGGVWNNDLKGAVLPPRVFGQLRSITHGRLTLGLHELEPHSWGIIDALNLALARLDLDERFYWIQYPDDGVNGPLRGWGLIYLSYAQYRKLTQTRLLRLKASYDWGTTRVNDTVATLKSLGLLSHLSEVEAEEARREVLGADIEDRSIGSLLCAFRLIYWVDAEMIYDIREDYGELIAETGKLSRGVFAPDSVQIGELDTDRFFTISFVCEGSAFSKRIRNAGGWIDWDYLVLMNEVLAGTGRDHRFCRLETSDQTAQIIFLDGHQLKEIRDKNLLPLEQEWDPLLGTCSG